MNKKLWHRSGCTRNGKLMNDEVFMKPLCMVYASQTIKLYGHTNISYMVRYQHMGMYNFLKGRQNQKKDGSWWRWHELFYLSNIYTGGHYGLCKKSFDTMHDNFMALNGAISAGHMDLLKLYLANIPWERSDLIMLLSSLMTYISPKCDWYYETATILLKYDSTIANSLNFNINDQKILELIL